MPFSTQWLQYWWNYPQDSTARCASLLWFIPDAPIAHTFVNEASLTVAATTWCVANLSGLSFSNGTPGAHPRSYMQWGGLVLFPGLPGIIPTPCTDQLPISNCFVIKLLTATMDRAHTGHVFVSGVPNSFVVDNRLTPFAQGYLQSIVDFWQSPFTVAGVAFRLSVVSYKLGASFPVVRATVMPNISILRKRKRNTSKGYFGLVPKNPPP